MGVARASSRDETAVQDAVGAAGADSRYSFRRLPDVAAGADYLDRDDLVAADRAGDLLRLFGEAQQGAKAAGGGGRGLRFRRKAVFRVHLISRETSSLRPSRDQTKLSRLSLTGAVMRTINIHEAKTHLSRLVDEAEKGEPFIIAKAGKPKVKVVPIDDPPAKGKHRLGFMKGVYKLPENFDKIDKQLDGEIEELFLGEDRE